MWVRILLPVNIISSCGETGSTRQLEVLMGKTREGSNPFRTTLIYGGCSSEAERGAVDTQVEISKFSNYPAGQCWN